MPELDQKFSCEYRDLPELLKLPGVCRSMGVIFQTQCKIERMRHTKGLNLVPNDTLLLLKLWLIAS